MPIRVFAAGPIILRPALWLALILALVGCVTDRNDDPVAKHPDVRIVVAPAAPGSARMKAWAPECPAWTEHRPGYYDNTPQPQLGCANQRNLALMIDRPTDLVAPSAGLPAAEGTRAASGVQRYREGKVFGLYDPTQPPAPKE